MSKTEDAAKEPAAPIKEVKVRKPKKGEYYEIFTSARKINVLREGNINFSSHFGLLCAIIIAINAGFILYKTTRPVLKSAVFTQYHEEAAIMTKIKPMSKTMLGTPLRYEAPVEVDGVIGPLPIKLEIGIILQEIMNRDAGKKAKETLDPSDPPAETASAAN